MQPTTRLSSRRPTQRFYFRRHARTVPPADFSVTAVPSLNRLWDPRLLDSLRTPVSRVRE